MKPTEKIRLLIAGEAVLALLCAALAAAQVKILLIMIFGIALEGLLLILAVVQILRPMERFEKTIREMNQEREPTPERIHEIVSSERYFPLGS